MLEIEGDIYLIGDIHGKKFQLIEKIKDLNIADAYLILLGDIGVGFNDNNYAFDYGWLNDELKKLNCKAYLLRGNHDNPSHWKDDLIDEEYENIIHLKDHQLLLLNDDLFMCIGGGTSIDRCFRDIERSYWSDENISLPKYNELEKDIIKNKGLHGILSHCGPLPPKCSNIRLDYWYLQDADLRNDLQEEQLIINKIFDIYQPKFWFFGHYHVDESFDFKNCKCICLNELSMTYYEQYCPRREDSML